MKPILKFPRDWCLNVVRGACMGAADIVPGISGGTLCFIMGIYDDLLRSISSFNLAAVRELFRFQFRSFFRQVGWEFLLTLLTGITFSIVMLASFFHFLLGHEVYRIYLYGAFFGLVLAAILFCSRQIDRWNPSAIAAFTVALVAAFLITSIHFEPTPSDFAKQGFQIHWWMTACGMIAIMGLLLPGISGSYMLNILGVYPFVIAALAGFVQGIKQGVFLKEEFSILFSMAIGIVFGALIFSRVVHYCIRHYHNLTVAVMMGLMVGAIRTVWPFHAYRTIEIPQKGPILIAGDAIWPSLHDPVLYYTLGFVFLGFALVTLIETIATRFRV